jgi:hypothetical protein
MKNSDTIKQLLNIDGRVLSNPKDSERFHKTLDSNFHSYHFLLESLNATPKQYEKLLSRYHQYRMTVMLSRICFEFSEFFILLDEDSQAKKELYEVVRITFIKKNRPLIAGQKTYSAEEEMAFHSLARNGLVELLKSINETDLVKKS